MERAAEQARHAGQSSGGAGDPPRIPFRNIELARPVAAAGVITVVVAAESYLLREGVRSALDQDDGFEVVDDASTLEELWDTLARHRPDVVVVGPALVASAARAGTTVFHELRSRAPSLALVALTRHADHGAPELLQRDLTATAYLLENRIGERRRLARVIREAVAGGVVLEPELLALIARRRRERPHVADLTPREEEVLALIACGWNNATIARTLVLTTRAVEKHINSIFRKLGLQDDCGRHPRVSAVLAFQDAQRHDEHPSARAGTTAGGAVDPP